MQWFSQERLRPSGAMLYYFQNHLSPITARVLTCLRMQAIELLKFGDCRMARGSLQRAHVVLSQLYIRPLVQTAPTLEETATQFFAL